MEKMRNANETTRESASYTRLQEVRMNAVDRQNAINAMEQAEQIIGLYLLLKEKLGEIGQIFLKPSLKS
jgi:hypothetical protein